MKKLILFSLLIYSELIFSQPSNSQTLTIATYNVSMEAENYVPKGTKDISEAVLMKELSSGSNAQIRNIARIIKTVRPDILLLNEFDYIQDPEKGIKQFVNAYLKNDDGNAKGIDYPYFYYSTVNTGQPSPFDLDRNGKTERFGADAWGFGWYPGQYGMVLISRFPIEESQIRTFQHFKWKDMPGALKPANADGSDWYSPDAWAAFPLSSKSHWDIPVKVGNKTVHVLASHPTPPTFDGAEDRNGKRNHDEIRFWRDYISGQEAAYIYDDKGVKGGIKEGANFVILGDQNASPDEGNALSEGIKSLLGHPKILSHLAPASKGGLEHTPGNPRALNHTAFWRMRADYVLPSATGFSMIDSGVFWPAKREPLADLVEKRESSSDHRLVWAKVKLD